MAGRPGNAKEKPDTLTPKPDPMKTKILLLSVLFIALAAGCKTKSPEQQAPADLSAGMPKMITAKVYIKPGLEEDFIKVAQWIIDNTHKEEGCLEYTLYQDPYNRSNFFFFERYKDQAAIDLHFAAPYFKEFGDKISDWTSQPTEIKILDIAGER